MSPTLVQSRLHLQCNEFPVMYNLVNFSNRPDKNKRDASVSCDSLTAEHCPVQVVDQRFYTMKMKRSNEPLKLIFLRQKQTLEEYSVDSYQM